MRKRQLLIIAACGLIPSLGAPLLSQEAAPLPKVQVEPPLPALPPPPVLDAKAYPQCREGHQKADGTYDKVVAINKCLTNIDRYYESVLLPFRRAMITHQDEVSALYTNQVGGKPRFSAKSQQDFYKRIRQEHADSDTNGVYLSAYRAAEARYQGDRTYLRDRYCFNTGCDGYPTPGTATAALPPPPVAETKAKSDDAEPKAQKTVTSKPAAKRCKTARAGGNLVGGLIGGFGGRAAGLKNAGSLIASQFVGVLAGEIACQLNEKEQKKASEATVAVTKQETVGAVANWQSPTREGVSGSSTVTAVAAQPNGRKCLTITDVVIVDGEETQVSKQMCRKSNGEGYAILA